LSYLLDTNVLSELRKGKRCNRNVLAWYRVSAGEEKFLSVLSVGEIRRGIEIVRRRDPISARSLDAWLAKLISNYSARILGVDEAVAEKWGRLMVPEPLPVIDAFLAATAVVHGLTLVTRNVEDVRGSGVSVLNPFERGTEPAV
jgi:predicted nucleic acid-binding protein